MSNNTLTSNPSSNNSIRIVKSVTPKGKILNDNGTNVDHLGHVVYAEALAQQIQTINTPVTVGIFSKWGSGKSFLLKHVQSLLRLKQRRDAKHKPNGESTRKCSHICNIITFFVFVLLIAALSIFAIWYHSALHSSTTSTVFLILLLFLFLLLYAIVHVSGRNCFSDRSFSYRWTLFNALFTILPIRNVEHHHIRVTPNNVIELEVNRNSDSKSRQNDSSYSSTDKESENPQRYIFVNFNAWEYAGTDVLWAGIVTNLADRIEREFGTLTSRIFRTISLETTTPYQPIVKSKHTELLVKLPSTICHTNAEIEKIMSHYGVVINCQKYTEWIINKKNLKKSTVEVNDKKAWWVVTFENQQEAESALITMKHYCIESKLICKEDDCKQESKNNTKQPRSFRKMFGKFWAYFKKQPKRTCRFANLYWFSLFVFAAVTIPIISFLLIYHLQLTKISDTASIFMQIFSWLPSVGGVLYVIVSTIWAQFHSQKSRVVKALEGIKSDLGSGLGFMHKVKREVEAITDLVHAVEFVYDIRYKVVIMIDDLDRIPLAKARRVLESVNILLSERNSPFVCLIAVDSRIAVKCFQETTDSEFISNINGYEYLKKIINLPFCIPKVDRDNRSKYIAGLIDEADQTEDKHNFKEKKRQQQKVQKKYKELQRENDSRAQTPFSREADYADAVADFLPTCGEINYSKLDDQNKSSTKPYSNVTRQLSISDIPIHFDDFLFQCRNYMFEDADVGKHIYGNPRNIKRIFNVISVTTLVICCHQDKKKREETLISLSENNRHQSSPSSSNDLHYIETHHKRLAEDIVLWIILSDQWPFRVSYILEAIEDADQRADAGRKEEGIKDEKSLLFIYEKIRPEIACCEVDNHHFTLDVDSDIFYSFLKFLQKKERLNKGRVKELLKYSVNLDHSIRHTISYIRNKKDLNSTSETDPRQAIEEELTDKNSKVNHQPRDSVRFFNERDRQSHSFHRESTNSGSKSQNWITKQAKPSSEETLFPCRPPSSFPATSSGITEVDGPNDGNMQEVDGSANENNPLLNPERPAGELLKLLDGPK